jgi:hypothetical protein
LTRSRASRPAGVATAVTAGVRSPTVSVRRVVSQGALESTGAGEQLRHIKLILHTLTEELRGVRRISRLSLRRLHKEVESAKLLSMLLPRMECEGGLGNRQVRGSDINAKLVGRHDDLVDESDEVSDDAFSVRQYVSKGSSLPIRQYVSKSLDTQANYDFKRHDRVAAVLRDVNKSAFEVYGLHIALRLQLGRIIMYRKKKDRTLQTRTTRLEARLIALRTYDEILYSGTYLSSAARVRKKLTGIEHQSPVQRFLVRSPDPGAQLLGRTSRRAADSHMLRVHYRRNRMSRRTASRATRLRFVTRRAVRYHTSVAQTLSPRPVRKVQANWQRRQARSWRRVQSLAKKDNNSGRTGLVQTVSSWLDGSPVATKAASPVAAQRRRRPFGSRAFGSGEEE